MLHWSLVFLIIALIAALLGFTGLAGGGQGKDLNTLSD